MESAGVLIVDGQLAFAESLARVLADASGLEVLGAVSTGAEGVDLARREVPDVALVDRVDVVVDLRSASPTTRTVLLASSIDDRVALAAIDAGCAGFVTKDGHVAEIVDAARRAAAGDMVFTPTLLSRILPMLEAGTVAVGDDLTPREREVLAHMASGSSNRAIAADLELSVNTVRNYVQSILTKLGAHSKLEAVAIARRERLLDQSS
jgi:DNA-binding NarL/FixJ family response regulator